MINKILKSAGVNYKRTRFSSPPKGTYAVYMDDQSADGPDGINAVITHEYTIEVYESAPDDATEEAIEAALNAAGLRWTKQDRYWLQDVQRYQVVYEFTYIEKRRIING